MKYPAFREQGFFVGSGIIEAGCKSIAGVRLKQSGMFLGRTRSQCHHCSALLKGRAPPDVYGAGGKTGELREVRCRYISLRIGRRIHNCVIPKHF